MVVVRVHLSGVRRTWSDNEPVLFLVGVDAQTPQFRYDGSDAVGLFTTDEADSHDACWARSERGDDSNRLSNIRQVGHVYVHAD